MSKLKHFLLFCLLFTVVSACNTAYKSTQTESSTYRFNNKNIENDTELDSIIAPYKSQLEMAMNEVIGYSGRKLIKSKPESSLGNWLADALRDYAVNNGHEVDFAIQNYGGIRIGELPEGSINRGQIFELMPFENMLVILEADGNEIMEFFQMVARYGGWPVSSEIKLFISNDEVSMLSIAGKEIDPSHKYIVAMPDYIANGGDNCSYFKDNPRINTGKLVRDILIADIITATENGNKVKGIMDRRIEVKN